MDGVGVDEVDAGTGGVGAGEVDAGTGGVGAGEGTGLLFIV